MITIYIDDKPYEVPEGRNLLHTIISLGLDLPYFCWHPALGSVGACRQCAVIEYKDENDDKGKLVMACMEPIKDGLRCSLKAPDAEKFRANIIEWLMTNHPHDCPVCDEGGECHLQDMTVMSGHNYRRYRFNKRTFRNQDLGPFIYHEMNRCITCYRCVRFYHDYAGGEDLQAFGAHNHVYFGRHEDGALESEFSGNLVEVCPTGVFTDKTLRHHYTRKWDLQSGPSICQHCSLGCNTLAGERYGKLVRILNRYNRAVNGYFICDRGRFGYEFVNGERRIHSARIGKSGAAEADHDDALMATEQALARDRRIIGIGSPRASLETNFALRELVGKDNFYHALSTRQNELLDAVVNELKTNPAPPASIHEVEQADAVFVLGEDLTNTAPILALAVRQAVRNKPMNRTDKLKIERWQDAAVRELLQDEHGPFYQANVTSTKLDKLAVSSPTMAPQDIARLGFAVAHAIDPEAPEVEDLDDGMLSLAQEIARALKEAENPVVIAGTSLGEKANVQAAANCAKALRKEMNKGKLSLVVPECNSIGLGLLEGIDAEKAIDQIESDNVDTVVVVEADLYEVLERNRLDRTLEKVEHIICIDHTASDTSNIADIVLAAATFAEGDGTLINNEGRAQRFFQATNPSASVRETWKWLADLMKIRGMKEAETFHSLDGAAKAVFNYLSVTHDLDKIAPSADFRINHSKVARSPHRYSGRTAMTANISVHEPESPHDSDSPLTFSMEGIHDNQPGSLTPFYWTPGWNSVQSTQHYMKEVGAELRGGDPGLRLFEPGEKRRFEYHGNIPEMFLEVEDGPLCVPLYAIFGSEQLSNQSAPIQERIPAPYVAMNDGMLNRLGCTAGDRVNITHGKSTLTFVARSVMGMPDGLVGIINGHPELPPLPLPARVKVAKGGD